MDGQRARDHLWRHGRLGDGARVRPHRARAQAPPASLTAAIDGDSVDAPAGLAMSLGTWCSLKSMKPMNLGEADGLPAIDWSLVEAQLADLLMHDDPRSPNRATFWLTTLN